MTKKWTIK